MLRIGMDETGELLLLRLSGSPYAGETVSNDDQHCRKQHSRAESGQRLRVGAVATRDPGQALLEAGELS